MMTRTLNEIPIDVVRKAVAILRTEQLYRSEKVLGVGEWLLALHESLVDEKNLFRRDAILWQAVATAPAGFTHVRSSMIGTLLADLEAGMELDTVKRRFDQKMHPLQYRRPTAAPSDGQIAQAERVIAELRTAGSLERRFAKIEDLVTVWKPKAREGHAAASASGVFGHLRGLSATPQPRDTTDVTAISWAKFARSALPTAETIECLVPVHGDFIAFVTAANPDAPPIVQWDREDRRNPVTWYVYNNGSPAAGWNLRGGEWRPVTGIALNPAHWDATRPMPNHRELAVLVLDGARDMRHERSGGLFVEHLRGDYNAIRHTLEAHLLRAPIAGSADATACGLVAGRSNPATVRVTAGGVRTMYRIDRWD
jgi:hypothetical protein